MVTLFYTHLNAGPFEKSFIRFSQKPLGANKTIP
jgi:hypothetical protein